MTNMLQLILFLSTFFIIALASREIGGLFSKIGLPKISGFLFAGLIAGPFVLGLASKESIESLRFLEELSLAFIAFAAGSELYLPELRGRFRSIGLVTASIVVVTLIGGTVTIFLIADFIPFMRDFSVTGRIAVSLMVAAIMVARSPSVAIALINELRAKGPFTQITLGVTVVSDVVVIMVFALSVSIADALLTNVAINLSLIGLLLLELVLSLTVGLLLALLLRGIMSLPWQNNLKTGLILLAGLGIYFMSNFVREYTHEHWPFELLLEPLLICMVGSFVLNNFTKHRLEFSKILHDAGPVIYVIFFTLVGLGLKVQVLLEVWPIALAIFGIRVGVIFLGSLGGGVLAGEPMKHNWLRWMVFVTQAGVALGLAKEVAVEFPGWGDTFATTIIAAVVLNEIVGPLLFKSAMGRVGEAHVPAEPAEFDGVRDAIIFGLKAQALTLARQLKAHGWEVKIATSEPDLVDDVALNDVPIRVISDCTLEELEALDAAHADSVVALLSDEMNLRICELVYEHYGVRNMVVRLNDRENRDKFVSLGARIVEPETAVISLLDHFVRAPIGTSMLLGMAEEQDIVDIEVCNPDLHGISLRDLKLPLDVLILSIQRDGHAIISHGYTQLHLGDIVTMVGNRQVLDDVSLRFEA